MEQDTIYNYFPKINSPLSRKAAKVGTTSNNYDNPYVCGAQTALGVYLNKDSVKQAIHVNKNIDWGSREEEFAHKYTKTEQDLRPYYKEWVKKYPILVYYGDVDTTVPYLGGEQWTSRLGYDILDAWRPWTVDGEMMMGGYVQVYDTGTNFTFLTIRGAGHMVPQYKPMQAFFMIKYYLLRQKYPQYNPSKTQGISRLLY